MVSISQQATTKSLLIHITDVNDNPPVFTEPDGYYFAVDEGKAGLTVGMVTVNKSYTAFMFLKLIVTRGGGGGGLDRGSEGAVRY